VGNGTANITVSYLGQTVAVPVNIQKTLTHLTASPANLPMMAGAIEEFTVYAHYSDNSMVDVTNDPNAEYDVEHEEIAALNDKGVVMAYTAGETNIVVTYGGKQVTVTV